MSKDYPTEWPGNLEFTCPKVWAFLATDLAISVGLLKKREGVPEMGTKPLKALRGYRASSRGSKNL